VNQPGEFHRHRPAWRLSLLLDWTRALLLLQQAAETEAEALPAAVPSSTPPG